MSFATDADEVDVDDEVFAVEDFTLQCPFNMICAGPTNSGKSTFVARLCLLRDELYSEPGGKVFWFYKASQPLYDQIKASPQGAGFNFVKTLPNEQWIEEHRGQMGDNPTMIIDDMGNDIGEEIRNMFQVLSHHEGINFILICHNLFMKNKVYRDVSLNSAYIVLMKNPRDRTGITHFAQQFAPGKSKAMTEIYAAATRQPHSYLFLDLHQRTKEAHRIRSNILFEQNEPMSVYQLQ